MAEETRQRKKLVEFVRSNEVDTVLEVEVCKFGERVGWVSRAVSEESPMVNYQKKLEQRRIMAKNTPSPTSKSSFLDESPHFMHDKNQTPSSKGKDSGVFRMESNYGHVLSFGAGQGPNFFASNPSKFWI